MGNLIKAQYRRDYTGETISYVKNDELSSIFVTPRELPHDLKNKTAIVLGNGPSRISPEVQLLLTVNNNRPAEGYKMTYACNAAFRDTKADYYVVKNNLFWLEDYPKENANKIFTPSNTWLSFRDTNLIPYVYHFDAGSSAAYLAAFDGAEKVFLFGFDGTDGTHSKNIYADTAAYESEESIEDFYKFNVFLYDVVRVYSSTKFYRVRNHLSNDFTSQLTSLPNYFEVNVRDAILAGDF